MLKIPKKSKTAKNSKKIIIANWKMNPVDLREAKKMFSELKKGAQKISGNVQVVVCPPSIYLQELSSGYRGNKFVFGAQDVSVKESKETESTGEISVEMLKNAGAKYVLIGHSEQRAISDTNETVSMKLQRALSAGMTPVLCIGETDRDMSGNYLRFIEQQIHESLSEVPKAKLKNILIAYEPVWAIGKGHNAMSGYELHQMTIFIKKTLSKIYDKKTAMAAKILYGGSVDEENCDEILTEGEVNGLLVGRASLNSHVFVDLLKKVD
jgi:triosephosphate isomerase